MRSFKILILVLVGSCALMGCGGSSTSVPTSTPRPSAGSFSEFSVPTSNSGPAKITAGPDGNLWFTENMSSKIGRITLGG